MDKIGFGEQPYLVYQYHDAGHPHIHIVSLCVRADGSRIPLHNIGRNQSEKARKEIEVAFGLVKASGKNHRQSEEIKSVSAQVIQYGRSETKQAIAQVLQAVLKDYRYTSLPELNAILRQYNVMADPGSEESRVYQHHGLTYLALDGDGIKIGVPIKASDFPTKPTLKYLERKFLGNEELRQPHKTRVKNAIYLALLKQPNYTLQRLIAALEKEGIHTARRETAAGMVYGLTYVDHKTRCIFNGSDLGKPYSAKGLQERCRQEEDIKPKTEITASTKMRQTQHQFSQLDHLHSQKPVEDQAIYKRQLSIADPSSPPNYQNTLDLLVQPEPTIDYVPGQLKMRGKKKMQKRF